ncbi:hypothetical protein MLD38_015960 [Melastoma candidum]|uniref:Uncharacterized protein n=1 Tax=Melastoma candidum TaxID=119954 RepID=A0ACB9RRB7_9MYRT|nr:hypothetical protein MLD38_015960 [Melastoma candidum]
MSPARSLEGHGLPSKHTEAVSLAISKAANATFEEVSANFVKKTDQEHYACNSQHEIDKVRASMERIRTDLLYKMNLMGMKIDKLTDVLNVRLEANEREFRAEIGTTRAEIGTMKAELIAKLEGARYDMIKYFVGTIVSVSALSAAVIRYFVV